MSNNNFKTIYEVMNKYKNVLIAGHRNPDGDSIGSCIALGLVLSVARRSVRGREV